MAYLSLCLTLLGSQKLCDEGGRDAGMRGAFAKYAPGAVA